MNGRAFRSFCMGWKSGRTTNRRTCGRHLTSCPRTGSGARGKQFLLPDFQSLRQKDDLGVSHATNLRLDFGNGVFANVPTGTRTARRQHGLRPTLAVTDFAHDGTDNVLRNGFAHDFALTICERALVFLPISEGTICQQARTGHLPTRLQCTMGNFSVL